MDWLIALFNTNDSVAHIVLLYSVVIAGGVLLGKVKIGGISLGVTFVLFVGILAGHIKFTAPINILTFMQDFGLILFVFCIGLQVGPGFFESFKKGGIKLNLLSMSLILLNVAAANEALSSMEKSFPNGLPQIASGYACAYPLGVLGIIGATIAVRYICRVDLQEEEEKLAEQENEDPHAKPHIMHVRVNNSYLDGRTLGQISEFLNRDMVCTRLYHDGKVVIPQQDTVFSVGDEALIVCAESDAEAIQVFIGEKLPEEWAYEDKEQPLVSKRIVVTRPAINGKLLREMHFTSVYGVNITRITRQGMNLFASPSHRFQIGDRVVAVGPEDHVDRVAEVLGNSARRLDAPNVATIFIGIIVGILFGSIPVNIQGIPAALKLGIAGGPLVIAILIGRFGYKFKLITYTTTSANLMLREIGLALFLASVGIKAGAHFWDTVIQGDGIKYVYTGFIITVIPILIIGTITRLVYKFNYFTIMGMLAGTCTDPPALAYANQICSREAPGIGYSTVYPLSMFLRIFTAQLIVLFFCG